MANVCRRALYQQDFTFICTNTHARNRLVLIWYGTVKQWLVIALASKIDISLRNWKFQQRKDRETERGRKKEKEGKKKREERKKEGREERRKTKKNCNLIIAKC